MIKPVLHFVVLFGLAACSREPSPPAAVSNKPAAATPAHAEFAADSVAAVLQSTGRTSPSLRFAVGEKPSAGKATPVRLDVLGEPGTVTLRFQGEGLAIEPAAAAVVIAQDGKASQSVSIKPHSGGISEFIVRIQPSGDDAQELVYAIPLLVEGAAAR